MKIYIVPSTRQNIILVRVGDFTKSLLLGHAVCFFAPICRYLVKIVDKSKVGGGRDRRTKSVTPNTSKIELNTLESNPNFLNILSNATMLLISNRLVYD